MDAGVNDQLHSILELISDFFSSHQFARSIKTTWRTYIIGRRTKFIIIPFIASVALILLLNVVILEFSYETDDMSIKAPVEPFLETSEELGLYEPMCKQPNDPKSSVVVLVTCAPDAFEKRKAIRESWASLPEQVIYVGVTVTIYFVLGETLDKGVQNRIRTEAYDMNDIIQGSFVDSYDNLTMKSLFGMRWAMENCGHRFLLKTDQDVWLNTPNLIRYIRTIDDNVNALLTGHVHAHAMPYRSFYSKYSVSYSEYVNDTYPDFISGTGYMMSRSVLIALYRCAVSKPKLLHLEDVQITGICANELSIKLTNNPLFNFQRLFPCGPKFRKAITSHGHTADEMRQLWMSMYRDGYPFAPVHYPVCNVYSFEVVMSYVLVVQMVGTFMLCILNYNQYILNLINH